MTANNLIQRAKELASCKTMYVKGCPCLALNQRVKLKYTNDPFNSKRAAKIFAATEDTIGVDEVTMFEYIFSEGKFGNIGDIMDHCHDISKDFKTIIPGEIVFMQDRVGVYIGDGKVITCSAAGVGETILDGWVSHGKMMFVDYIDNELISLVAEASEETSMEKVVNTIVEELNDAEPKESDVEVRSDSAWVGDRMQSLPQKDKSNYRGHGRYKSSHMPEVRTRNGN